MNRIMRVTLFAFLTIFTLTARCENIVFDLFGVLVYIPTIEKIKHSGVIEPLKFALHHRKGLNMIKTHYFTMLSRIHPISDLSFDTTSTAQGTPMPEIMVAWQAGAIGYLDALRYIEEHLAKTYYSDIERRLFQNVSNLAFDLETRKQRYRLMNEGVMLVERLHAEKNEKGERRHKLFILSNMDHEMMTHLTTSYPHFFALFDGMVYSAEARALKPQPAIFQTLFERYTLMPKDSVLIDDQQENIDAAIALEMGGILYDSCARVSQLLEQKKLLTPKE